jgi:hypothetical protein
MYAHIQSRKKLESIGSSRLLSITNYDLLPGVLKENAALFCHGERSKKWSGWWLDRIIYY